MTGPEQRAVYGELYTGMPAPKENTSPAGVPGVSRGLLYQAEAIAIAGPNTDVAGRAADMRSECDLSLRADGISTERESRRVAGERALPVVPGGRSPSRATMPSCPGMPREPESLAAVVPSPTTTDPYATSPRASITGSDGTSGESPLPTKSPNTELLLTP